MQQVGLLLGKTIPGFVFFGMVGMMAPLWLGSTSHNHWFSWVWICLHWLPHRPCSCIDTLQRVKSVQISIQMCFGGANVIDMGYLLLNLSMCLTQIQSICVFMCACVCACATRIPRLSSSVCGLRKYMSQMMAQWRSCMLITDHFLFPRSMTKFHCFIL